MTPEQEEAKQISTLIRKRASAKAKLTLYKKFIDDESKIKDIVQLKQRTEDMVNDFKSFSQIQDELDILTGNAEKEVEERSNYSDSYYEYLAKATSLINAANSIPSSQSASITFPSNHSSPGHSNSSPSSSISLAENNNQSIQDNLNPSISTENGDNPRYFQINDTHLRMPAMPLPRFNNTCEA